MLSPWEDSIFHPNLVGLETRREITDKKGLHPPVGPEGLDSTYLLT